MLGKKGYVVVVVVVVYVAEERVWSDRGHIGVNMIVNHELARGIISLASLFSCSLEKLL